MPKMSYDDFRIDMSRRITEIREEGAYGMFIGIAERHPEYVKQPYMFIADRNVARKEKISMLKVVLEISGGNPIEALKYMFDIPENDYKEALMGALDNIDMLRSMIRSAYSYMSSASEEGLDAKAEHEELEDCLNKLRREELVRDISRDIDEFIDALKSDDEPESGTVH